MRRILIDVWQGKLTPGQALNELQDAFIRDGPKFKKLRKKENWILAELEALRERAITTTECEEEIKWILNNHHK
jgi:hypothetical protein